MNSQKVLIIILILVAGLLSACGGRPTDAPASAPQPTMEIAAPIQAPTNSPVPTDTLLPTETAEPTEAPATPSASSTASVSFTDDILSIFQSRCVNCHGGERLEKGLSLRAYADMMAGSENGMVITAGNAENSLLADLISTRKMPKRGPMLTPPQVQIIIDWINQGTLDN